MDVFLCATYKFSFILFIQVVATGSKQSINRLPLRFFLLVPSVSISVICTCMQTAVLSVLTVLRPVPYRLLTVDGSNKCCITSTETVRTFRDGEPAKDGGPS